MEKCGFDECLKTDFAISHNDSFFDCLYSFFSSLITEIRVLLTVLT